MKSLQPTSRGRNASLQGLDTVGTASQINCFCCIKQPIGHRPIRHWLDGRVKAYIFMCYLSYLLMKTLEHMLKKGGLTMNAENALKQLSKVKHVVVTNSKGDITTSKISIPSTEQRQIMDVLEVEYIKSKI